MAQSLERKLISITWPFVAVVILMLSLSLISMNILSAARAYVGGGGLWSKAERDAVSRLLRFSRTRSLASRISGIFQASSVASRLYGALQSMARGMGAPAMPKAARCGRCARHSSDTAWRDRPR